MLCFAKNWLVDWLGEEGFEFEIDYVWPLSGGKFDDKLLTKEYDLILFDLYPGKGEVISDFYRRSSPSQRKKMVLVGTERDKLRSSGFIGKLLQCPMVKAQSWSTQEAVDFLRDFLT
ncbi:hypothetical protein HQ571_00585 [Candidatus Kuenenbacteria bacterium]|nr:hypothetical protein [Candidatus Kuenenbacteria bacterium]